MTSLLRLERASAASSDQASTRAFVQWAGALLKCRHAPVHLWLVARPLQSCASDHASTKGGLPSASALLMQTCVGMYAQPCYCSLAGHAQMAECMCRPMFDGELQGRSFPFTLLLQTGEVHSGPPVSLLPGTSLLMVSPCPNALPGSWLPTP